MIDRSHVEELGHEDRRQRRVDRRAAVHLRRRPQRDGEGGVGPRDAEVLLGHPLGHRQRADRGAGHERQLDRRPRAGEVPARREAVRPQQHRVDDEQDQGEARVDRTGEDAERAEGLPAVRWPPRCRSGRRVPIGASRMTHHSTFWTIASAERTRPRNGSAGSPTLSAAMPMAADSTISCSTLKDRSPVGRATGGRGCCAAPGR